MTQKKYNINKNFIKIIMILFNYKKNREIIQA